MKSLLLWSRRAGGGGGGRGGRRSRGGARVEGGARHSSGSHRSRRRRWALRTGVRGGAGHRVRGRCQVPGTTLGATRVKGSNGCQEAESGAAMVMAEERAKMTL
jgi:hypothetical protein